MQDYDDTFPFWVLPCYNNPDFPRGGLHWISSLVSPSETLLLVDSWNDLVTPWAHTSTGIYPRVAFANGPGPAAPDDYTVIDLNLALDTLSRHSGGANILFVDGHTKWFKGDQIISRTHGGKLRICGQDLTR
ncbi:MAG: H-X9-DG-CTERM domain-containing protein [bacterium]